MPPIEELFQKIFSQGVNQWVTVATRFMSGQPQTGIDHLYTNEPEVAQTKKRRCSSKLLTTWNKKIRYIQVIMASEFVTVQQ